MVSEESTIQSNLIMITAICKKDGCRVWTNKCKAPRWHQVYQLPVVGSEPLSSEHKAQRPEPESRDSAEDTISMIASAVCGSL